MLRFGPLYLPDTELQRLCVMLFRFEVFFPFRETIRMVLWDIMTLPKPNSTCYSVLKIISGLWWPIQLFRKHWIPVIGMRWKLDL